MGSHSQSGAHHRGPRGGRHGPTRPHPRSLIIPDPPPVGPIGFIGGGVVTRPIQPPRAVDARPHLALVLATIIICTVDRIEGDWAIAQSDDNQWIELPAQWLPKTVSEGDSFGLKLQPRKTTRTFAISRKTLIVPSNDLTFHTDSRTRKPKKTSLFAQPNPTPNPQEHHENN